MKDAGTELDDLRERDLERYCNQLRRQKRAETSIARTVASIRGWFAYLVVEGYLASDPSVRLKGGRRGRSLPKPLAEDEVTALLDSIPMPRPVTFVIELCSNCSTAPVLVSQKSSVSVWGPRFR